MLPIYCWASNKRVFDFSLDNDRESDNNKSFTHASFEKVNLPQAFTKSSSLADFLPSGFGSISPKWSQRAKMYHETSPALKKNMPEKYIFKNG